MTPSSFPDLSLAHRPELFEAIRAYGTGPVEPMVRCDFGGRPGWLVGDLSPARLLLTSSVGRKSRPEHSQRLLGGVGAMHGERVRGVKRRLVRAMTAAAGDRDAVIGHLRAALPHGGFPAPAARVTEAVASAMLAQVTGQAPGSVDGALLRSLVHRTWSVLESPAPAGRSGMTGASGPGVPGDGLLRYVTGLVSGSDSAFLRTLAADGWTVDRIAEELRAMVLAGWGSTTAATLSAISLGVRPGAPPSAVDEVLRLYPPSFMIARTVVETRGVLPFDLGDLVVVSPWLIHRHRRGWQQPESFRPDRWRHTSRPYWFMPFGLGARRCPAAGFARAQVSAALRLHGGGTGRVSSDPAMVESRSPSLLPDWA
ncbi:cytochrome P450 [Streptomyces sp. TLI_235]|nr:cytochrome P450 [Streptomyces sp. TLI_235]PBC70236.1 cytochrome P450 [Streptomyces sp. TLI_235]